MKKKRRFHTSKRLKPYLSQTKNHVFYELFKNKVKKENKIPSHKIQVLALPQSVEIIRQPKHLKIKSDKNKKDILPKIKNNELQKIKKQTKFKYKKMKRRLLVSGRDLFRKRKLRRNKTRIVRKLRNKAVRKQGITSARMRYYPISMHGLLLQNRRIMFLPPSRKTFHLLKIILKSFLPLLNSAIKKQIYWFSTLRQLLLRLFSLPGFFPKLTLIRQINLIIMKELSYKHNNSSYFRKLYKSRWILFQGAFSALSASINSFDRTRKIGISFIGMYVRNVTAALVCNYIVHKLGQYFTIQETLRPVIFDLRKSPRLDGFKIVVAGRLTRKERAAFLIKKKGKLTRSTNDANIDYFSDFKIMRFGVVGVKVWFQIKKRKPYFYRFAFLLFYIAALALWQLLSPVIIARLSILINLFGLSIKIYVLQDKHILSKYVLPILNFFTRSRICCHFLISCANFKTYLFNHDNQKVVRAIIRASRLIVYLGWAVRTPLILKIYVPFAGLILFVLGVNGVFRAIISIGILLTSGDNFIKQLVQAITRHIHKIPPAVPPNTPSSPQEPNNNNDENKKDSEEKKEKEEKDNQQKTRNTEHTMGMSTDTKIAFGALGIATTSLLYTVFTGDGEKTRETIERVGEEQKKRDIENQKKEDTRHKELLEQENRRFEQENRRLEQENKRLEQQKNIHAELMEHKKQKEARRATEAAQQARTLENFERWNKAMDDKPKSEAEKKKRSWF